MEPSVPRPLSSLILLCPCLALPFLASPCLADSPPVPTPSTKPPAASSSSIYDEPPTKNIYEEMEEADRAAEARELSRRGLPRRMKGSGPMRMMPLPRRGSSKNTGRSLISLQRWRSGPSGSARPSRTSMSRSPPMIRTREP